MDLRTIFARIATRFTFTKASRARQHVGEKIRSRTSRLCFEECESRIMPAAFLIEDNKDILSSNYSKTLRFALESIATGVDVDNTITFSGAIGKFDERLVPFFSTRASPQSPRMSRSSVYPFSPNM